MAELEKALDNGILVLDGGFGTMVQGYNLTEEDFRGPEFAEWPVALKGCNDVLSLTRPDIVAEIHDKYLEAGARIIETNSFNTNAISLADYSLQDRVREIARAAARVARECADRFSEAHGGEACFVAGSMGPTGKSLSMSSDVSDPGHRDITFTELAAAYREQALGLIEGGVDLLMVETAFDTLNAKAALYAIRSISEDFPVIVSGTVSDASGRLLSGQTVEAFYHSISHARPLAVGLNCGYGARHLLPHLRKLAAVASTRISVHPNAGLPNIDGGYDETPEMFAADCRQYLEDGLVNIIGGCCGTTPDHIAQLAEAVKNYTPGVRRQTNAATTVTGLEPLEISATTGFVNVGERTNVAGSAKFARLIRDGNYAEALTVARDQVTAGAQIIDICMDDAMIDGPEAMRTFLNLLAAEPEIARVPVMIDSSKWEVILAGLGATQGKSVVNSISLKEGEEIFLQRARELRRYGAAVVVMLFDEQGQADTFERKMEVARRAYSLLTSIGFPSEDIIFDPNILAISTGIEVHDRYALDFIRATRSIKEEMPKVKISGGVSNLSFAFRGNNPVRKAMHSVFLYHAIVAGMDMAIVNPQMVVMYDDISPELLERVEDAILSRRPDASQRLIDYASSMSAETESAPAKNVVEPTALTPEERVRIALIKGDVSSIEEDVRRIYDRTSDAIGVIDNVLMPAMAEVGHLFGEGKMFLPQVVKSARVMRAAVDVLTPFISQGRDSAKSTGHVVIATVKGDVHDIGKNIVAVVLECNGYCVTDLGVMVDAHRIIDEAVRVGADAICLSGLITPSLEEMVNVVREARRRDLQIPVIVGGATTSDLHTAVKIALETDAPVIRSRDAADNAHILSELLSDGREEYVASVRATQQKLRDEYAAEQSRRSLVPLAAARACAKRTDSGAAMKVRTVQETMLSEVAQHINWDFFFSSWGIPGRYPYVFDHHERGAEARKIFDDATRMLSKIIANDLLPLTGCIATFPARSDGDDVVVKLPDGSERRLPMLRNQQKGDCRCCADFLAQDDDTVTLFAVSAGTGLKALVDKYRALGDDYSAFMAKLLADRLTEALAETLMPDGCRIAFGYPAAPDHSLKRDIFDILDAEHLAGLHLTETYMIVPPESICGICFPRGEYFSVGPIGDDQARDYARRRGISTDMLKKLIPNNIL